MSRTGTFGRLPKVASSLTATLTSIAQEMENRTDSDIMSAWQKGGTYEGQPVTDAMMINHWKTRLAGVSKDDPLYDQYAETITQLTYSIAESKMTAAYSQKKASDAQMIAFYKGQLKNAPVNSEFYRVIQRDIGQYMARASANHSTGVAQAKETAYVAAQNNIVATKGQAGQNVTDLITRMAQTGGPMMDSKVSEALIGGKGGGADIGSFTANDPDTMLSMLNRAFAQYNTHGRGQKSGRDTSLVLYTNSDGSTVTVGSWIAAQKKADPSFDGNLTAGYMQTMLHQQILSIGDQIALAKKTGHNSQVAALQGEMAGVAEFSRERADGAVMPAITVAKQIENAILQDPNSSSADRGLAITNYRATLAKISLDPRIATDSEFRNRLMAEATGNEDTNSVTDDFTGNSSSANNDPVNGGKGTVASENDILAKSQADAQLLATGDYVNVQGKYDANHNFTPSVGGSAIGVVSNAAAMAMGTNPQAVTYLDPHTGQPITMIVSGIPVKTTAINPATGVAYTPLTQIPITTAYSFNDGTIGYTIKTGKGSWFSTNGNFAGAPTMDSTGKGMSVSVQPPPDGSWDSTQNSPDGVSVPGYPGWYVTGATAGTRTAPGKPGHLTYNPQIAASANDTSRPLDINNEPTIDPTTDFFSLQLMHGEATPANQTDLTKMVDSPTWLTNQTNSEYAAAGYTKLADGTWDMTSGDPHLLELAGQQARGFYGSGTYNDNHSDWFGKGLDQLGNWKNTAATVPDAQGQAVVAQNTGNPVADAQNEVYKQAYVSQFGNKGVDGTPLAAIGGAWKLNSSALNPSNTAPFGMGQAIQLATALKVPTWTPSAPPVTTPAQTANPTSTYKPTSGPMNNPSSGYTGPTSGGTSLEDRTTGSTGSTGPTGPRSVAV